MGSGLNASAFPVSATAGRAWTGRPARRWSTSPSTRWRRSCARATTPTTAALFAAAKATDATRRRGARARSAALLGADPRGVVVRPERDRADDALRRGRRPRARARRRGRRHAPGPRRQRAPVGDRRRARRGDRPLRRARPRRARAPGERGGGGALRAHPLGRGDRRQQRVRLGSRAARASSRLLTPPGRTSTSTRCTPRRTVRSTSRRWAPTRSCARPTSGSGRTSAILATRPELLGELSPDKLLPSSDEAPDRWELGTLPFESLAGVTAAAAATCARPASSGCARTRTRCSGGALDGLRAIDGVTLHGDAARPHADR